MDTITPGASWGLELQAKEREDWQDYGIRWEWELKKDRAQVCGQVLSYLEETDWLEFMVGVLRGYVDFRATSRDEEDEFRYRAPLLDWWLLLTDGFKKGRLVVEKDAQTLPKRKRWNSESVAQRLAGIGAAGPGGHGWREEASARGGGRGRSLDTFGLPVRLAYEPMASRIASASWRPASLAESARTSLTTTSVKSGAMKSALIKMALKRAN